MSHVKCECKLVFGGNLNPNARMIQAFKNRLDEIVYDRERLDVEEETLNNIIDQLKVCPKCNGSSEFDDKQCPQCGGKGILV